MLVCTSSPITPDFFLLTLGESCFYLLEEGQRLALFDCGSSLHLPMLLKRLEQFSYTADRISDLFIIHPFPERIAGLPYLRKISPNIRVHATARTQRLLSTDSFARELYKADQELTGVIPSAEKLPVMEIDEYCRLLSIDKVLPDTETVVFNEDVSVRCFVCPGCTEQSAAYYLSPHNFIVACQGFGYFRGRELAAPAADFSLTEGITSVQRFNDIVVDAVCLPFAGVLTGDLARKHLHNIVQNTEDLFLECRNAFATNLSQEEIFQAVKDSFYASDSRDPLLLYKLEQSFEQVWKQILEENRMDEEGETSSTAS